MSSFVSDHSQFRVPQVYLTQKREDTNVTNKQSLSLSLSLSLSHTHTNTHTHTIHIKIGMQLQTRQEVTNNWAWLELNDLDGLLVRIIHTW